jgi:cation-transporting P-type ATPase I
MFGASLLVPEMRTALREAVSSRVRRVAGRARRVRRKIWTADRRTHVQLRELPLDRAAELSARIREALEATPGVRWARVNAYLGRVIVDFNPERLTPEQIEERVNELEEQLGLGDRTLPIDGVNPGDAQPIQRILVELGADTLSFGASSLLRLRGEGGLPFDIDLAAIIQIIEGIPRIKAALERRLSAQATDLILELTKSTLQLALRSETGPVTAFMRHLLRLRDAQARRRVWNEREPELCGDPDAHPPAVVAIPERPASLRKGAIETYDQGAIPVALSAFGLGSALSFSLEKGSSALFGGMPQSAHRGRSAFAHHLAYVLARRGVLVADAAALRRLDRLDVAVLARSVLDRERAAALVEAVRGAGLRLVVASDDADAVAWADADRIVESGNLATSVRALQQDGSGVLLIGDGFEPAYRAADLAVGLTAAGTPWGADLTCRWGLDDARVVIDAIEIARTVSQQSVYLAAAEAGTALVLTFTGLERRTTRRIMTAANAAAVLSMANGIRHARALRRPIPVRMPSEGPPWHRMSSGEVLERIGGHRDGLTGSEADARKRPPAPPPSRLSGFVHMVGEELANPMTPILAAGAGLSALVGSVTDALLIGGAVAINGVVGGVQRYETEKAIGALHESDRRPVRVKRDRRSCDVLRENLVVGDVVELHTGDFVPGDGRILTAENLEVDESSLTGESMPVAKQPAATGDAEVAERTSMLYDGTTIAAGEVEAVVVALGEDTEAGRAAQVGAEARPKKGVEERLERLAALSAPIAGASAVVMTVNGLLRGRPLTDVVGTAVSLGVAAVPEGLPILATMAQLAAARRLSRQGALVRNPRAIEPLGRVDVLCADKTGTLTEGKVELQLVCDGDGEQRVEEADEVHRAILQVALHACPVPRSGARLPHATDHALVEGGRRVGLAPGQGLSGWERRCELPFEPARGFHASYDAHDGGALLSVKGAPEVVVPRCVRRRFGDEVEDLDDGARRGLIDRAIALARRGFRVLAVAERAHPGEPDEGALEDEQIGDLTFRGFITYADPVRSTARRAVAELRRAGVEVIMLTGDHPSTAEAIGAELELINGHGVMTGAEVDALDDAELDARIGQVAVFARVTPAQKVRIVRALQHAGRTVAMTGDGANDAPAIRLADVGIALGEGATTAARHAADMVVTDGRIETIVHAVLEGRALWSSVRDAVAILLGGNLGEIAFTVAGGLIAGYSPLNARQLLLVNLMTDTLPALAIALKSPRLARPEDLLREGPEASLGDALDRDMAWRAVVTAGAAGTAWMTAKLTGAGRARASTIALLTLTGAQLGQTLAAGGASKAVLATGLGSIAALGAIVQTPVVSHFFGCRPLGPVGLLQAGAISAAATGVSIVGPRLVRVLRERRANGTGVEAEDAEVADEDRRDPGHAWPGGTA